MTALAVVLHGAEIGELVDLGASAVFRFYPSYWRMARRPVLGQWFEDGDPAEAYAGPAALPAFFDNLEPEGALARAIARRPEVGGGVLDLLAACGADLPGALVLRRADPARGSPRDAVHPTLPAGSLSGVQPKLSAGQGRDGRVTLPLPGTLGSAIVKVPPPQGYKGLVHNEAACLAWAGRAGFDAARARVVTRAELSDEVAGILPTPGPCLWVERYDRGPNGPVHQEDLAQATWLAPTQKYPAERADRDPPDVARRRANLTRMEGVAAWSAALLGPPGAEEFLRRATFVVASGNGDAHLKNWSLVYPDRRTPTWSPLYDQVSTIAWSPNETLALPIFGVVNFAAVNLDLMVRLGAAAGLAPQRAREIVEETLLRLAAAWSDGEGFPPAHADRLRAHWRRKVPLLTPFWRDDRRGA